MRPKHYFARVRRRSAATLISSCVAFQFGACIPSEFSAVQTTTVTLDGRTIVTTLINAAIITPLQTFIEDAVNSYFDQFQEE
jgi:fucose permease